MRTGAHLTIQDYFKAVVRPKATPGGDQPPKKAPGCNPDDFSRCFQAARAAGGQGTQRLGIQDYFENPLRARAISRPAPAPSPPLKTFLSTSVPQVPEDIPAPEGIETERCNAGSLTDQTRIRASIRTSARLPQDTTCLQRCYMPSSKRNQTTRSMPYRQPAPRGSCS